MYDPSDLPQCNGPGGLAQCAALATGCPVPWPTVEQFQQWGRFVSQQDTLEDPVLPNLLMEASAGVGLAATMAATGIGTAARAAYLAVPTSGAGLFAKVFPYAARAIVGLALDATKATVQATQQATTAARAAAGVIRAGAPVFVIGTVITAIVTIALEAWIIAEHMQIPITLLSALNTARSTPPDLAAVLDSESGAGALLTTFISTTRIDVDPDCVLASEENGYSKFPCANGPAPAPPTAGDDRFYVTTDPEGVATGEVRDSIYLVNPVDSTVFYTANENVRASGPGWFVATKYNGALPENEHQPTIPGATLQSLRLYYQDWEGDSMVAERVRTPDGRPAFRDRAARCRPPRRVHGSADDGIVVRHRHTPLCRT